MWQQPPSPAIFTLIQSASWSQGQLAELQRQAATADELSAYATLVRNYLAYSPSRDG